MEDRDMKATCEYCGTTECVQTTQIAADTYGGGTYTYEAICAGCEEDMT